MCSSKVFCSIPKTSDQFKRIKKIEKVRVDINKWSPADIYVTTPKYDPTCLEDEKSIKGLTNLPIKFLTIHTSGGKDMMQAAMEAVSASDIKVFGVTVLTSLDDKDLQTMGINISSKDLVVELAKLTKISGLAGVVCSSKEIKIVREACGVDFKIIVPGIRPEGSDKNDQKRIIK